MAETKKREPNTKGIIITDNMIDGFIQKMVSMRIDLEREWNPYLCPDQQEGHTATIHAAFDAQSTILNSLLHGQECDLYQLCNERFWQIVLSDRNMTGKPLICELRKYARHGIHKEGEPKWVYMTEEWARDMDAEKCANN